MFVVSLMCLVLGMVGFIHDSVSWQMPVWLAVSMTVTGATGMLFSARPKAANVVKK